MAKKELLLPPQNIEAEEALLGAILSDSSSMDKLTGILKPADFYEQKYGKIFESCLNLYQQNIPVDAITVKEDLEKKKVLKKEESESLISFLVSQVPSVANSFYYAQIVKEKAVLRNLISASRDVATIALSEELKVQEVLDLAEKKIFEVSQVHTTQKMVQVKETLESAFERIEMMHREPGKLRGLKTGFHDFDNLTSGLQKGDFVVLAGRPSMGKSTLALDIAKYIGVNQKAPVAMFMLEMSTDQVVDKLIASSGHIDLWRMRTGKLRDEDFEKIASAFDELNDAPIFIDDSLTTNVLDVRTKCRRIKSEQGLGLIVVDYLQLLEGSRKDNRVQEVSEISRQLKSLAKELDVPVLALSQLSRNLEMRPNKRPILSDLRESGSIEQDADMVAFIYRDAYYKRGEDENLSDEEKYTAEIIVAKHRNGPTGMIKLYFNEEEVSFRNLEKSFH